MTYETLAATASRLITKKGRSITLVVKPAAVSDPAKPWRSDAAGAKKVAKGVAEEYKSFEFNQDILRGDKKFLVSATGLLPPDQYYQILDGGDTWSIVNYQEMKPGDVPLVYVFQARK